METQQDMRNGVQPTDQTPPGVVPIDQEEFLAAIGELYLQTRLQRKVIISLSNNQSNKSLDSS